MNEYPPRLPRRFPSRSSCGDRQMEPSHEEGIRHQHGFGGGVPDRRSCDRLRARPRAEWGRCACNDVGSERRDEHERVRVYSGAERQRRPGTGRQHGDMQYEQRRRPRRRLECDTGRKRLRGDRNERSRCLESRMQRRSERAFRQRPRSELRRAVRECLSVRTVSERQREGQRRREALRGLRRQRRRQAAAGSTPRRQRCERRLRVRP
jgi:hypothetical protein